MRSVKTYAYSQAQKLAIFHNEGPCMVLAGPGSGKTSVITGRAAFLINEGMADPSSLLVVTFTNAAAFEMRERFSRLCGGSPAVFGTFHSVYYSILRESLRTERLEIINTQKKKAILKEVLKGFAGVSGNSTLYDDILSSFSRCKNLGISPEELEFPPCDAGIFLKIYESYNKLCRQVGKIDFDDILLRTKELFLSSPEILRKYQNRFKYIMVDEFQDINRVQYDTLRLLSSPRDNLFIVGDDDQSIYSFRGAAPDIMLNFKRDYKDARTILLDANYRCQKSIVSASLALIKSNKKRFAKRIISKNDSTGRIKIIECENESKQYEKIAVLILDSLGLRDGNLNLQPEPDKDKLKILSDSAVFSRVKGTLPSIAQVFTRYGIPYILKDEVANIYEHWIVKDIFAYINIANGSRARADFFRVMNRPERYISREAFDSKEAGFDILYDYYRQQEWMCERLKKWQRELEMISKAPPFAAVNLIRFLCGYDDFIKEHAGERLNYRDTLMDILVKIQDSGRGFVSTELWREHIEKCSKELLADVSEGVTISSLHASKGLEYDNVYIVDASEGVMPYRKALGDVKIEEERRIFYVGMTRARKNLTVTYPKVRGGKRALPSRFLAEIADYADIER